MLGTKKNSVMLNLENLEIQTNNHNHNNKVQFEAFIQKIRTKTYKKTNGASSLKFTYPSRVVNTSWG